MLIAFSPIGPTGMIVIGIVALLLFGNRLPEVARSLGRAMNEFKRGLKDTQDSMQTEEDDTADRETPQLNEPAQQADAAKQKKEAVAVPRDK